MSSVNQRLMYQHPGKWVSSIVASGLSAIAPVFTKLPLSPRMAIAGTGTTFAAVGAVVGGITIAIADKLVGFVKSCSSNSRSGSDQPHNYQPVDLVAQET